MDPQNNHTSRVTFATKLGAVAAAVGSAVGLGNIWRFPFVTGENGGGAFLVIYLLAVFFLGIPLLIAEFLIGRSARSNAAGSFKKLAPHTRWPLIGYMGVFSALLILGFYTVISGWTVEYIWLAVTDGFNSAVQNAQATSATTVDAATVLTQEFVTFSTDPLRPLLWLVIFIAANYFIIVSGVAKGIERASNIMMPILFILLLVLCIRSFTLPGVGEGLSFLFKPDFTKVNSNTWLIAIGQAFFSLSVGMGCLITYGSYLGSNTKLGKTALSVASLDTLIAILAGIIIFPACFSFGISPQAGPSLVFITLPNVFLQMPGGYFWAILFFVLVALAALTSTISLCEVVTAFVHEEFHRSRRVSTRIVCGAVLLSGIVCSLSLGDWSGYTLFGMNIFDFFDFITANIMMPIGAFFISLFVGWRLERHIIRDAVTNMDSDSGWYVKPLIYTLRYFTPLCILLIFLSNLGFFAWMERQLQ